MKYRRHQATPYRNAGKSMIPGRVSIHDRPEQADGTRFGDWEMDLVVGSGQKSSVLTVIERSQNMFMQKKLPSKKKAPWKTLIKSLGNFSRKALISEPLHKPNLMRYNT